MSATLNRSVAGALVAGIAAVGLAANPLAATDASAATHVNIKDNHRADVLRARVAKIAKNQAGERYISGATGPGAFDCSGLVVYSYKRATGITLPRTSYSQIGAIKHVSKKDRRVGDIAFFRGRGHVAIYIGKGRVVQALNPGVGVKISSTRGGWTGDMITGYGRVIRTP
jgi:cell wall-associated NlpC family hydrolase